MQNILLGSEEIFEDLIGQLLDNTKERELYIEIEGYPSDFLDDPREIRECKLPDIDLVDGNEYVGFKLLSISGDDLSVGLPLDKRIPLFDMVIDGKRMAIPAAKLMSMLYRNAGNGYVTSADGTDGFYIKVSKQLLFDSSTLA